MLVATLAVAACLSLKGYLWRAYTPWERSMKSLLAPGCEYRPALDAPAAPAAWTAG
jgi:hypothetical protein